MICGVQDRFGKPPEVMRSKSDEDEGLSFTWAPATLPAGQPLVEEGGEQGRSYLPLMGSLRPEADEPNSDQLMCAEVKGVPECMPSSAVCQSNFFSASSSFWEVLRICNSPL